jgi:signal transduction histidine kinase
VIRSQVARLAKLTDAWLRSDQMLQGATGPALESIDCATWIEAVVSKQPDGLDGHVIRWQIAPDATTLCADPSLLEVVLMNLLSNACKYSPPGSPIEIRTRATHCANGEPMTGLQVTDVGIGIDPALHERVFERYFRARPEGPVSGVGLGLSLVRHIVAQHRGTVELHSAPGAGSTFTAWFPDRVGRADA